MNVETWQTIVRAGFRCARRVYRGGANWWPDQASGTALAWAIAMQWAFAYEGLGTRTEPVWVSASGGTDWQCKSKILGAFNVDLPNRKLGYSTNELRARRFSRREYLLDFTVWPSDKLPRNLDLSMESECYDGFDVEAEVEPANGYAYDFYKLMLVPSPRRVFVCRVNNRRGEQHERRDRLLDSLNEIANDAAETTILSAKDELSVLILAAAQGERDNSILAVWEHKKRCFDRIECDPGA